jgi:hypothetical protein
MSPGTTTQPSLGSSSACFVRGGTALLCLGSADNPEVLDRDSWLGIPMYWSHFDEATTTTFLVAAGFEVGSSWEIPDPMGHGSHRFVLARAERRELVT